MCAQMFLDSEHPKGVLHCVLLVLRALNTAPADASLRAALLAPRIAFFTRGLVLLLLLSY